MSQPVWKRAPAYESIMRQRLLATIESMGLTTETWGAALPEVFEHEGLYAARAFEPVGYQQDGTLDRRWHISINGANAKGIGADGVLARLPTWTEMTDCAHVLRPGVTFVVGVPPRSWWMAEIESGHYVLHLWQVRDENLEQSWMEQRTPGGRRPS